MIHNRLTTLELITAAALLIVLSLSVASEDWLIAGLALAFTATATIAVYAHSVVLRYKNEFRAAIARLGLNLSALLAELKQDLYLWILIGLGAIFIAIAYLWMGVRGQ